MSTVIAEKFYTVAEACEILGLTRQRVCALIKSGQLQADKAHRMLWLIPAKSLNEFKRIERPPGQHIEFRKQPRRKRRS
jgi:excisionase family DNA binding protein